MIQSGRILQVIDNSGATTAFCIRILGNKKKAKIGDKVIVSIRTTKNSSRIIKSSIHTGLLVKVKKNSRFIDGRYLIQNSNGIILLNNQMNPIGNRIFSSIIRLNNNKVDLDLNLLNFSNKNNKELFLKLNILSKTLI